MRKDWFADLSASHCRWRNGTGGRGMHYLGVTIRVRGFGVQAALHSAICRMGPMFGVKVALHSAIWPVNGNLYGFW
jgi:hypothetical protein